MHRQHQLLALLVSSLFGAQVASADPILWRIEDGGNGHYFDRIDVSGISWGDANAAANASLFNGLSGHLATITSQAETDFLLANINVTPGGFVEFWLGGFQDLNAPDYSEPSGGWRWITGEPFVYTNWAVGQPNQSLGRPEDFLSTRAHEPWKWNDVFFEGAGIGGYVVEFEPATVVPEPSSLLLWSLGMAGMFGYSWRRRRSWSTTCRAEPGAAADRAGHSG